MLKELIISLHLATSPYLPVDTLDLNAGQREEFLAMETMCLAQNVYHEARNQGTAGQLAVVSVTLNRVADERFPDTICGVVYEGPARPSWKGTGEMIPVRNQCQFSWYCDGKSDEPKDLITFQKIYDLMYEIVYGSITVYDITDGATHYHADYVRPAWAATKTKTIEIEDHIFYRWEKR